MKKDCIGDFVQAWKDWDIAQHNNCPMWHTRFAEAGYYRAIASETSTRYRWRDLLVWCHEQLGGDHYFWSGDNIFWFESEQDAMLFILKWS
jgi:hypothetical protein